MGSIFSSPKQQYVPPPPTLEDPALEDEARRLRLAAARAKGQQSTILTGGQGVVDDAPVTVKTLLGS